MSIENPICVALDMGSAPEAIALADSLVDEVGMVKVGLELFCSSGPVIVESLRIHGLEVFLDLKLNDIPNTVASTIRGLATLRPRIINVHSMGGLSMMKAAKEAAASVDESICVVAVTILTSLDRSAVCHELGIQRDLEDQVLHLAGLARDAGLDGVVCSPHEVKAVRKELGADFMLITPGIRPAGASADDQARYCTPEQALDMGADVLVIGRPITQASDPRDAAHRIRRSIA